MKVNFSVDLNIPTLKDADNYDFPGASMKIQSSLECSDHETDQAYEFAKDVRADWLEIRQEIVKAMFTTEAFKCMFTALWEMGTALIKRYGKLALGCE